MEERLSEDLLTNELTQFLLRKHSKGFIDDDVPLGTNVSLLNKLEEIVEIYREEVKSLDNAIKVSDMCNRYVRA